MSSRQYDPATCNASFDVLIDECQPLPESLTLSRFDYKVPPPIASDCGVTGGVRLGSCMITPDEQASWKTRGPLLRGRKPKITETTEQQKHSLR